MKQDLFVILTIPRIGSFRASYSSEEMSGCEAIQDVFAKYWDKPPFNMAQTVLVELETIATLTKTADETALAD